MEYRLRKRAEFDADGGLPLFTLFLPPPSSNLSCLSFGPSLLPGVAGAIPSGQKTSDIRHMSNVERGVIIPHVVILGSVILS